MLYCWYNHLILSEEYPLPNICLRGLRAESIDEGLLLNCLQRTRKVFPEHPAGNPKQRLLFFHWELLRWGSPKGLAWTLVPAAMSYLQPCLCLAKSTINIVSDLTDWLPGEWTCLVIWTFSWHGLSRPNLLCFPSSGAEGLVKGWKSLPLPILVLCSAPVSPFLRKQLDLWHIWVEVNTRALTLIPTLQ